MNRVISDTAEYGYCCLITLVNHYLLISQHVKKEDVGRDYPNAEIDNASLIEANEVIRGHSIEAVVNALELL